MKDRILHIMRIENMSQQDFARSLEISPATLSNIFNGKTNPTGNHVAAIHRRFPNISVDWVMFGEGNMYKSSPESESQDLDSSQKDDEHTYINKVESEGETCPQKTLFSDGLPDYTTRQTVSDGNIPSESPIPVLREVVKFIDKPQRKITEIRIFFDDGTYEVFSR